MSQPDPRSSYAVHPHACGEYIRSVPAPVGENGSSPRVWGIRARRNTRGLKSRFIPTRVGNTINMQMTAIYKPVHPHACGEYVSISKTFSIKAGSSPRVWGIHILHQSFRQTERFIPTRVGNTALSASGGVNIAVHPHACGEYSSSDMPD